MLKPWAFSTFQANTLTPTQLTALFANTQDSLFRLLTPNYNSKSLTDSDAQKSVEVGNYMYIVFNEYLDLQEEQLLYHTAQRGMAFGEGISRERYNKLPNAITSAKKAFSDATAFRATLSVSSPPSSPGSPFGEPPSLPNLPGLNNNSSSDDGDGEGAGSPFPDLSTPPPLPDSESLDQFREGITEFSNTITNFSESLSGIRDIFMPSQGSGRSLINAEALLRDVSRNAAAVASSGGGGGGLPSLAPPRGGSSGGGLLPGLSLPRIGL